MRSPSVFVRALLVTAAFITVSGGLRARETAQPPRVLIISSYHEGYYWSDEIKRGLLDSFSQYHGHVDIAYEYLDTKRQAESPEYLSLFAGLIRVKYTARPPDLLIVCDNSAFNFASLNKDELFKDIPVVFCGINNYSPAMHAVLPNSTGVAENKRMNATIDLILRLHEKTRRIVIISDDTVTGRIDASLIREDLARYRQLDVEEYSGSQLAFHELLFRLRALQDDTVVFFSSFWRDRDGISYIAEDALSRICEASPVPVYTHADTFVTGGVTGGVVVYGYRQGLLAGNAARKILSGVSPESIRVESEANVPLFDYIALRRWDLRLSDLPAQSVIINRPAPSVYERYTRVIWGVVAVIAVLVGFVVILGLNITLRRRTEAQLMESRQQMELALEGGGLGIWDWDTLARTITFDRRSSVMIGYPAQKTVLSLENWEELIHPDDFLRVNSELEMHLGGDSSSFECEYRLRHKDGHWLWIQSRGRVLERGAPGGEARLCGTNMDITERKNIEHALLEKSMELENFFESAIDLLCIADTDGKFIRVNREWEKVLGYTVKELENRRFLDFVHPDDIDATSEAIRALDLQHPIMNFTNRYRCADGSYRYIEWRSVPSGNLIYAAARDITQRREMEETLRQSQKLDAIGRLAGGVAHDFNNMIGGIMGALELLKTRITVDESGRRYMELIKDSAKRAADLSGKLLAFARRQMVSSTPVDVHKAIEASVALLENTVDRRIVITQKLEASQRMVIGDGAQLQSVFLNLGINAVHAMPEGGDLRITSRVVDISQAYCNMSSFQLVPGKYLEVEVRDSGVGIAPENLSRIFEPFFTTKDQGKGTGLGLSASYGIVQQHKGAITVFSEPGAGSSFFVLLPLTEGVAEEKREPTVPVRGKGRILLVDDEEVMRVTGRALLEEYGYEVYTAANGKEALEMYRTNPGAVDLVVLDMIMPRLNGRDTFFEIKKIDETAKIILSSGFARGEDLGELKEHGLKGFIHKPFTGAEFSRIVAEALGAADGTVA